MEREKPLIVERGKEVSHGQGQIQEYIKRESIFFT